MNPPPNEPYLGRQLPSDLELERTVLGAILTDPRHLELALAKLKVDHFLGDANQRVWAAVLEIHRRQDKVDPPSVLRQLRTREGEVEAVGGAKYIGSLLNAPVILHMEQALHVLDDHARQRRMILALHTFYAEGYSYRGPVDEYMQRVATEISKLADRPIDDALHTITEDVRELCLELEQQWAGEKEASGIPTGFTALDDLLSGLRPGALTVVAALPGGGKSTMALQTAVHASGCVYDGAPVGVLYYSLEMQAADLIKRSTCAETGVPWDRIRQVGGPGEVSKTAMFAHFAMLEKHPIVVATATPTVLDVQAAIRRADVLFKKFPYPGGTPRVQLIVIDYLHLMCPPNGRERYDLAIGEVTRGLKLLAMSANVHVILLSQFNRQGAKAKDTMPGIYDLKESSSIEQNADNVLTIYRPEQGDDKNDPMAEGLSDRSIWTIAKARNAAPGKFFMRFDGARFRFLPPNDLDYARWNSVKASSTSSPAPTTNGRYARRDISRDDDDPDKRFGN